MMLAETDDPLIDYENKPFVPVNPQEGVCGDDISLCFGWQSLIYLQTERVVNCATADGTFISSPVSYGMISIPTSKEVFNVVIPAKTFAVVHLSWPICGQAPGFYARRYFKAHDYGTACSDADESYIVPLCTCLPVLPPGSYSFGLSPTEIDTARLCRAEGDGSQIDTVDRWQNQIVGVRVCLEFVTGEYIAGRSTWS